MFQSAFFGVIILLFLLLRFNYLFGAERLGVFREYRPAIRCNLFLLKKKGKGFSLLSGLKGEILLFCRHLKKGPVVENEIKF